MISTGLFATIMILGIGAILNTNSLFNKNQDQRAIFDNVAFIMEDMSRLMRTGSSFQCEPGVNPSLISESPEDCSLLGYPADSIAFEGPGGDPGVLEDQIVYAFINGALWKSDDGWINSFRLTPPDIKFGDQSGFVVVGSLDGDDRQPLITVRLDGKIVSEQYNFETPFSYQVSITPRRISL